MNYENSWTQPGEGFLKEVQGPMDPSKVRVGGSGITYPYNLKDIRKQINPFDIYIKKPGAKKANLELQKALQKALKQKSFAPARLIMQRVQNKYRQLGADDTEPNAIITDILNQVFGTTRGSRESVDEKKEPLGFAAYDKKGRLVGYYRDLKQAKELKPGHKYVPKYEDVNENIDLEEAETLNWKEIKRDNPQTFETTISGQPVTLEWDKKDGKTMAIKTSNTSAGRSAGTKAARLVAKHFYGQRVVTLNGKTFSTKVSGYKDRAPDDYTTYRPGWKKNWSFSA